jgi:surfactin synthase thioesterase subunit
MKIFLLAHSGGNVWTYKRMFQSIEKHSFIPIEVPGNVSRLGDELPNSLEEYIDYAYRVILDNSMSNEQIGLFGHSFGGYLLYELAQRLGSRVKRVIVSGSTPFHMFQMPPEASDYSSLYGYPVKNCEEIVKLFDPIIRHKIELIDRYKDKFVGQQIQQLSVPVVFVWATDDKMTSYIHEWEKYYDAETSRYIEVKGGHFYWMNDTESREILMNVMEEI